jgi:hypothetical protein
MAAATGTATGAVFAKTLAMSGPQALAMSDAEMLEAFMKVRSHLGGKITLGWMDGYTFAVVNGATYPLYRLLAATWHRHERISAESYQGRTLEVAFFLDPQTGRRLTELTMPITGKSVAVPNYRAGPSSVTIVPQETKREEFGMDRESQSGSSFFRSGTSVRYQRMRDAQRDAGDFLIRQEIGTQVFSAGQEAPAFFYHEWTVNRAPWRDVRNANRQSTACEVQYSAMAAFRPWMQMAGVNGHTIQNGRGGKVESSDALPAQLLTLTREFHPDLIATPERILG